MRRGYRAKLVLRKCIPKGSGKLRSLGIPATEDKLLQCAVSRILEAIFESDFFSFSFGYRRGMGVKDALKELHYELQYGWYGYVVEADIKGFFDHLDHDWLIQMLELRISSSSFKSLSTSCVISEKDSDFSKSPFLLM